MDLDIVVKEEGHEDYTIHLNGITDEDGFGFEIPEQLAHRKPNNNYADGELMASILCELLADVRIKVANKQEAIIRQMLNNNFIGEA